MSTPEMLTGLMTRIRKKRPTNMSDIHRKVRVDKYGPKAGNNLHSCELCVGELMIIHFTHRRVPLGVIRSECQGSI